MRGALFAASVAFIFLFFCSASYAADPFYADNSLRVMWPDGVPHRDCDPSLSSRIGGSCIQIGEDGSMGAVFLTIHEGYQLGNASLLQAHLDSSQEALADIPRVQVMQTRILSTQPLIGMMDVLRTDGTLSSIERLKDSPIRQTSLLIPIGSRLAQIFVYLPFEGDDAIAMYSTLVESLVSGITVLESPIVPEPKPSGSPEGALALMPRALLWGGLIALVIIAGVVFSSIRRRKQREAEMNSECGMRNAELNDKDSSE